MHIICEKIKVWTKQNEKILDVLEQNGRYITKAEFISSKLDEHANVYLDVYKWYTKKAAEIKPKPDDAEFPIWVSLSEQSRLPLTSGHVYLELEIEKESLLLLDLEKWGNITNYFYLPENDEDKEEHFELLKAYRIDDAKAYMSNFYPIIKNKIIKSWDRLFRFDEGKQNGATVGTIWEVRQEWVTKVER